MIGDGFPATGSSPLARGLHAPRPRGEPGGRIIPARAGFTGRVGDHAVARRDHPRSRGVYDPAVRARAVLRGSSPLARGLRATICGILEQGGIIPARAGFTRSSGEPFSTCTDHPRSRGVYRVVEPPTLPAAGSSPLARGLRLIRLVFQWLTPDHPRSRGVYPRKARRQAPTAGSSPLARGLRRHSHANTSSAGIIPARAGFTHTGPVSTSGAADHPRSRGVYRWPAHRWNPEIGSSPLARGLPAHFW